jgi:hypothetical protein
LRVSRRSLYLTGFLAAGVLLTPGVARADIRMVEQNSVMDSAITRWIAVKGTKRSIVTRAEVTGVLYDAGARYGAYVEIARPDKELIWDLDPQEKSYREVTASLFTRTLQKGIQGSRRPEEQPLRAMYRSQTTTMDVNPTGRSRRIAGYNAEEYLARVIVGVENVSRNTKGAVTIDQHIWLTKDPAILREVLPFEEAYVEQFGSGVTLQQAEVMAGEWSDVFINHVRALNDRVRKEGGYPLAVTTEISWEAIAQSKDEKSTVTKAPLFMTEVKEIRLDTIPDSEFELPRGFINQDTIVAQGPKIGPTTVANAAPPSAPSSTNVAAAQPVGPAAAGPAPGTTVAAVTTPKGSLTAGPTLAGSRRGNDDRPPQVATDSPKPATVATATPQPSTPVNVAAGTPTTAPAAQPPYVVATAPRPTGAAIDEDTRRALQMTLASQYASNRGTSGLSGVQLATRTGSAPVEVATFEDDIFGSQSKKKKKR